MTKAIKELRNYIDRRYDGSISAFARDNVETGVKFGYQINAPEIGKILRGERGEWMTVRCAAAIEAATGGAVGIRMWLPDSRK